MRPSGEKKDQVYTYCSKPRLWGTIGKLLSCTWCQKFWCRLSSVHPVPKRVKIPGISLHLQSKSNPNQATYPKHRLECKTSRRNPENLKSIAEWLIHSALQWSRVGCFFTTVKLQDTHKHSCLTGEWQKHLNICCVQCYHSEASTWDLQKGIFRCWKVIFAGV